ncbi:MAG: hypothetical protein CSA34_02850 [Desulfobulbus propionicus]|nr:MAG: hypothetical protein CSA34_02850 [Desulfobulbus propionicus]
MIKPELLDLLACPKCKGALTVNLKQTELTCHPCRLIYQIRDGIPVMLVEEAKPLIKE